MSYVEKTVELPPNAFNSSILERSVSSLLPHLFIYPLSEDCITTDRIGVQNVAFEQLQNSSFSKKLSAKTTVQKLQPHDIHQLVLSLQYAIELLTQYSIINDRDNVQKVAFEQQQNKLCSTNLSAETKSVQHVQQPHIQQAASLLQSAINVLTLPTESISSSTGEDDISTRVVNNIPSQTIDGKTTTKNNTSYVTVNALSSNRGNAGRGLNVSGRGGRGRRRGNGCRRRGRRGGRRVACAKRIKEDLAKLLPVDCEEEDRSKEEERRVAFVKRFRASKECEEEVKEGGRSDGEVESVRDIGGKSRGFGKRDEVELVGEEVFNGNVFSKMVGQLEGDRVREEEDKESTLSRAEEIEQARKEYEEGEKELRLLRVEMEQAKKEMWMAKGALDFLKERISSRKVKEGEVVEKNKAYHGKLRGFGKRGRSKGIKLTRRSGVIREQITVKKLASLHSKRGRSKRRGSGSSKSCNAAESYWDSYLRRERAASRKLQRKSIQDVQKQHSRCERFLDRVEAQFGIGDSEGEDAGDGIKFRGNSHQYPRVSWRIFDTLEEWKRMEEFERRCKVGLIWGIKEEPQESSSVE